MSLKAKNNNLRSSVSDANQHITEDAITVVDVREPYEFINGHIAAAINIPLGEIANRFPKLVSSRDTEVFLVCQSGNRSMQAAILLSELGYNNIRSIDDGMIGWEQSGFEIEV